MIYALIILSLALPITTIYAFVKGYKLGQMKILMGQIEDNEKKIKIFKTKSKQHEPTDEEIKYEKILANIDAYDGSGKGQTKV